MCGIFGVVNDGHISVKDFRKIALLARQRGKDSSGIVKYSRENYFVTKADHSISKLLKIEKVTNSNVALGHSRLITGGQSDNQPVVKNGIIVLHNGIIVNPEKLWEEVSSNRELEVDSEILAALCEDYLKSNRPLEGLSDFILSKCEGVVACAIVIPSLGKLIIFSNNGSLYFGYKGKQFLFSSEYFPLASIDTLDIKQLRDEQIVVDIPICKDELIEKEYKSERMNLVPELILSGEREKLLQYPQPDLKRCKKCILPSTMPYIKFDSDGICNYCNNYQLRNVPKNKEEIFDLVQGYRRTIGNDCIVPFSGGRDSCFGLHLIVKELGMRPLAYTYDWGMVTDLGRRNISRMCSSLGVENIIIAADIGKKRSNIRKNVHAWLKSPNLGMISIFTAGDKHFFRHVETVKRQTGIKLNLWGINPLEVTHFKAGFLGIPPDFEERHVYANGFMNQWRYQLLRLRAMTDSPSYFNSSIWDTLSGEYYRSFQQKEDYFHIFDYWRWDEKLIDDTLINEYDWETAPDTQATWRIGDGTAAFYNYIYCTVAGFTEHDTFRSNQIREGQLSRSDALELVQEENRPRYPNLQWYLDSIGVDFKEAIEVINKIPKLYELKNSPSN